MTRDDVETRLRIVEADYGRRCGWYVEREGQRVGTLSKSAFYEMFWDRYRVESPPDPARAALLFENAYWCSPKYLFRNRTFSNYVVEAFGPLDEDRSHVLLRSLYIFPTFSLWERIRYAWRLFRAGYRSHAQSVCD